MFELIISYFVYNIFVGVILVLTYAFSGRGELEAKHLAWLLLFPASGLGNWRFIQAKEKEGAPAFPGKWYMWKYMIKVHWGFMVLLGILPVSMTILAGFGLFAFSFQEMVGFEGLFEAGMVAIIFLVLLLTVFMLIIPFLILIGFPMYQKRRIERNRVYELYNQKSASEPTKPATPKRQPTPLIPEVESYVDSCISEFYSIEKDRKKLLKSVAKYVEDKLKLGESVNLNFICTHNSRRSQFGQVWAAVAAAKYGFSNVQTYSGGTEETAFNKRAVEACKRAGLKIEGTVGTNPRYSVRYSDNLGALDCYSKTFDNPVNPQLGFAAVLTCSEADENCPFIPGAESRFRVTYEDPKVADRTPEETSRYDQRCRQIATEMLYLFSQVG